ncbi:2,5-diamino-6-(ribosylamino)-4(3H)-pyrimidinone 5'-phosphate reductase [Halogeometricum luteum]|uniref:2,5-diamino-6-(ribosylamino)-4(3H)-pyrimidinone 5'-phosphate reductase n=1 Tax=Halogeometricum luteum TaxID=2950537 RepID=A0ABU2FY25_9EURY|nr:2,5-diamino-6-(ribosylamino)-4(3H)-pyrimidinone 5'-phosphate reductase [Halogeometricum sp. S3BR5-2]MDS0292948.1 2,5-diamino-6-(ribosylamino)-4(3H)-pyrimidinone 5'-phosphate reductase [Halogeometricum sp. S3BR5-2]
MHVVVNAAASVDGKLSTRRREQVKISGADDFARVDRVRADSDAVLVGVGTVLADDPHLTLDDDNYRDERRTAGRDPSPARVVADSRARTPSDARILDGAATTYLLASEAAPDDRIAALRDAGAEVVVAGRTRVSFPDALAELESRGVDRLMVEGGGEVIFSLFEDGLVDELTLYVGSVVFGGRDAPTLADGDGFVESFPRLELREVERIDDGVLLGYDVP